MGTGQSVIQYLNRLTDVENKLASIGKPVDSDQKRRALVRGLSDEFDLIADMIRKLAKDSSSAIGMLVTKDIGLNRTCERPENDGTALLLKEDNGK